jgi:UDP-N-acetylmuramoyl-tripeptide--D-alanyl-D-alanine ligase
MIKPNCAIVTNISDAHLEGFGSLDNIIKEKTSIFDYSDIGFYRSQINIDYSNSKIKLLSNSLENFHYPEKLNLMFDKNRTLLENAFTVYHACNAIIDISIDDFFTLIEDFCLPKGRGQVHLLDNNIKMIDDTYNANPESVKAAIDNLVRYDNKGRKIFVFGDMKELGIDEARFHTQIGEYCSEKIDIIMCYGDLAKNTINHSNKIPIQLHFDTKESLSNKLCSELQKNDVILLKGSRSMKLDLIIKDIINYVK